MRLLTGTDRTQYETLLSQSCRLAGENTALHHANQDLKGVCEKLERDRDRERQRADNAIDELLALRGIAPVSVPPEPRDLGDDGDLFAEDPTAVATMEKQMMEDGYGRVLLTAGGG